MGGFKKRLANMIERKKSGVYNIFIAMARDYARPKYNAECGWIAANVHCRAHER
jgi:peptide methionine sulfoxide reductase MsrB